MSSKRNLSQIMNASAQKLSELERKERQCLAMDHALTRNGEKTIYALAYATMKKDKSRSFSYEVVHTCVQSAILTHISHVFGQGAWIKMSI